jgi:S1-C subfamily serine protease
VAAMVLRGAGVGFLRQAFSLGGFIAGIFVAAWLSPLVGRLLPSAPFKSLLLAALVLAFGAGVGTSAEVVAVRLEQRFKPERGIPINVALGAVFGGFAALLSVWLIAAMLAQSPLTSLNQSLQSSRIVRSLDQHLPQAPTVLARVGRLFGVHNFPQVFTGLEPFPATPVPTPSDSTVAAVARADQPSVVKIEGEGCGEDISGSGFVVAPGEVVTNAHVVAGISHPFILDRSGIHLAYAVYFDPDLDLAILRANLSDPALSMVAGSESAGTQGAVLGYPGGGSYHAGAAAIVRQMTAVGRNIYGDGLIARDVYEIQADVEPGNSGGPLVLPNGRVIGVVFAQAVSQPGIGYALVSAEVSQKVAQAGNSTQKVGTGSCTAE